MPKCKNCGSRLTKFDKERCPICGTPNPFANENAETVDITSEFNISDPELRGAAPRSRKKALILFILLGWTGYPFYYLRFKKKSLFWGIFNISFIACVTLLVGLFAHMFWLGAVISCGSVLLFNTGVGLYYLLFPDIKDGSGEFIH